MRSTQARRTRVAVTAGVGLGVVLAATQAGAHWTAISTPGSAGGAAATTVGAGPTPRLEVVDRTGVRVSWDAVTLGDGTAVDGYTLARVDGAGVARPAGGGCAGTVVARTCTEVGVPDGVWTYRVTPRFASWSGAVGAASAAVRTDGTPPVNDLDLQPVTGGSARDGSTYWYRGAQAGSFRLVNALRDTGSGPAHSATGAVSAPGWTHAASSVATPVGGPYVSAPYTWAAGTTSEHDVAVTGHDVSGNTALSTVRVRTDDDAPTGGEVDHPAGATVATTATVRLSPAADARSGVASRLLEGATAPLAANACGTWSAWSELAREPAASLAYPTPVGRCYRVRHVLTDRVGNARTVDGGQVSKVRDYRATITATAGLTSYWRLDDSGTTLAATRGASGTYGGGPGQGGAGAIAGDPSPAVAFDGADDHARVARPVAGTFSVELWFRSTQGAGTFGNWINGAGLVDSSTSVLGFASGFGIALSGDGRVGAGTGAGFLSAVRTVQSPPGLNDGGWHHVVMTRTQGSGLVELYVDGQLVGATTGVTGTLPGPGNLDLGRLQTARNHYRGDLDEVAVYSSVMPAATVLDHYRSGLP